MLLLIIIPLMKSTFNDIFSSRFKMLSVVSAGYISRHDKPFSYSIYKKSAQATVDNARGQMLGVGPS